MNSEIDVLVIGGGAAGAAAALQLGRIRRSVVVIDSGEPRNGPAAHMHGYLGHDGRPPGEFLKVAHAELAAYDVAVVGGRVTSVVEDGDAMVCTCDNGVLYRARRVILATGITDVLPDIPGLREHWGERVIHCPWCHGWEVRDQRVAVIDTSGMGAHQALMFAQLTDDVTLIRNHDQAPSDDEADRMRLGGVTTDDRPATGIAEHGDRLEVMLEGGSLIVDAVAVGPRFEPNASLVEDLVDLKDHPSGMGRCVTADDLGATSHPRIFAVGNVAEPMQQVLHAAAHGSRAAMMLNVGLTDDDIELARRSEADRAEWDERYAEHDIAMFSGRPNRSLVDEASHLAVGRALDVGCGEGADAIWLAQRGWEVTATDISAVAIDRATAAAAEAGVDATFAAVGSNAEAPAERAFDLVVVAFASLLRTPGLATFPTFAAAVAPGGRLLLIGHVYDDAAMAKAAAHGFDPGKYLVVDDMLTLLGADFEIEGDDERTCPSRPGDAHNHIDRVVVARRRTS